MMRILWISHNVPFPPVTGALVRNYNLFRRIANRHAVDLLCFNQSALLSSNKQIELAAAELRKFAKSVEIVSIPAERHTLPRLLLYLRAVISKGGYSMNWLRSREMAQIITILVAKGQYDVIHLDTISLAIFVPLFRDYPIVLNHHNVESQVMATRCNVEHRLIHRTIYRLESSRLVDAEQEYCRLVSCNVAVSEADAAILRRLAPQSRVEVCENGCDVQHFTPHEKPAEQLCTLIFVGNFGWAPNVDAVEYFFNRIWPVLKVDAPGLRVRVVGAKPPALVSNVASLDSSVIATGFVDDLLAEYRHADICICPLRHGGGTKLKLLEAMAVGLPIVTTSVGAEGLDLIHGQHALIADDVQDFVQAIKKIRSNPDFAISLGRAARELAVSRYSWDSLAERLEKIYELSRAVSTLHRQAKS
ncbi:MAG: glycosyltransferase family 4 protein [Steroidobacteraceae bacterium]